MSTLRSSPNHMPIESRGPITRTSHLRPPIYLELRMNWLRLRTNRLEVYQDFEKITQTFSRNLENAVEPLPVRLFVGEWWLVLFLLNNSAIPDLEGEIIFLH